MCCVPSVAGAQILLGTARAIDGDTLDFGGQHIRLHGMDAVEASQTCTRDGQTWPCGQEAKAFLARLVDGQSIQCEQVDTDRYGRIVARCTAGRRDLGQAMVEAGYAVALPQFSNAYVEAEARMRSHAIGIWAGTFDRPSDYRAAHPQTYRAPVQRAAPSFVQARPQPSGAYYANCDQARAAGVAPIYRGQPGYRPEMDGDNDGIACEPYRGR